MSESRKSYDQLLHIIAQKEEEIARLKDVERAFQKADELHHIIFSNIPCAVFLTDDQGNFVFISPNAPDLFGLTLDEIETAGTITDLLGICVPALDTIQSFEKIRNIELRLPDRTGRVRSFLVHARRIGLTDATFQYTCRDISDLREARANELEKSYSKLLQSISDYTYTVFIDNGVATSTVHGPGCVAVTGYTPEEYRDAPYLWHDMIVEEDRGVVNKLVNDLLSGKTVSAFEHRIIHKDGSIRWVKNTPLPRFDDQGRLSAIDSLVADITRHKESELHEAMMHSSLESQWEIANLREADFQTVCEHLLIQMVKTSQSDYGFYGFYSEEEQMFTLFSWSGKVMDDCAIQKKPVCYSLDKAGLWGEAIRKRKGIIVNDYHADHPGKKGLPEGHVSLNRLMVIPVFSSDEIVALGAVANKESDYCDDDLKNVSAFLSNVHILLERLQIHEELLKKNRALQALSRCNESVIRAVDEGELLQKACRILVETGNYPFAWIGKAVHDPGKDVLPVAQFGAGEGYLEQVNISWDENEFGYGPTGMAIRTGKTQVVKHIDSDLSYGPWRSQASERGYASSIALPLLINGKNWGSLNVYADQPDAFDHDEVALLEDLAENLAFGVAHIRMQRKQKKAEKALQESQTRMKLIYDTVQVGIVIIDTENRQIVDVNPVAEAMIGLSREKLTGKTCTEIFCIPEDGLCPILDLEKNGENAERQLIRANGEKVPILKTVVQFEFQGRRCLLESFLDISAIKEAENEKIRMEAQIRQMQKMEAIGTLAGGIAHDFNNMLMPIMAYSQILQEEQPPASQAYQDLEEIRTAAMRAKDLVGQILTFSREKEHYLQPVHIVPILKECMKLIQASFPSTISIELDITTDQDVVTADPTQIHQVIMNLCTNALHAMEQKGGSLKITLREEEWDKGPAARQSYLALTVSDTGCGMDRSTMERIFEPYFTTKAIGKGTGLGLSVVHGIIQAFNGEITVYSEPGQGTAFTVYLPLIGQPSATLPKIQDNQYPRGDETILLVDDELAVLQAIGRMLQSLGYDVTERSSSFEALEAFRAKPGDFDLIITDLTMPNLTGEQLAKELLAIKPTVPIILCSGYRKDFTDKALTRLGIKTFISKPVVKKELAQTIRQVLSEASGEEG